MCSSEAAGRRVPSCSPSHFSGGGGITHLDPPLVTAQGPIGHQPRIQHLLQEAAQLFGIVPRPRARRLNEDVEGAFWKSRGKVNRGRRSGESRGGTAGARGLQHLPMRWGHPQSSHQLLWLKDRSFTVRETVPPGDTAEPECWGQDRAVEDGAPLIKPQGERRCGACRGR